MNKFIKLLLALILVVENVRCSTSNSSKCRPGLILTKEMLFKIGYNEESTNITVRYKHIVHIEFDAFQSFPNVVYIDLSYNQISFISKSVFSNLFGLVDLRLNNNKIREIEAGSFNDIASLKRLNLNYNEMTVLDSSNLFNALVNIEELYMRHNTLTNMNWDEQTFISLIIFDVAYNQLTFISKCDTSPISNSCPSLDGPFPYLFINLKICDLSFNNIQDINSFSFYTSPNLEVIILSHNNISKIGPNTFEATSHLKLLKLDHNNLEEINDDTFNGATDLITLDLDHNEIDIFGEKALSNLNKIYKVCLYKNELSKNEAKGVCNKKDNPKCDVIVREPCFDLTKIQKITID